MVARWLHFASGREALLSANCSHHGATEETMEDVGCLRVCGSQWWLCCLHGGYSARAAEMLWGLRAVASMGRHNKPWRRLGGGETHREGFILTERPQMARHVRHPKRLASGTGVGSSMLALTLWNTLGPFVTLVAFDTVGDVGAVVTFVLAIFHGGRC